MRTSTKNAAILIIDDDAEIRYSLHRVLSTRQYEILTAVGGEDGLALAEKEKPEVVFLDNRMEGMSGLETLQHLRAGLLRKLDGRQAVIPARGPRRGF